MSFYSGQIVTNTKNDALQQRFEPKNRFLFRHFINWNHAQNNPGQSGRKLMVFRLFRGQLCFLFLFNGKEPGGNFMASN